MARVTFAVLVSLAYALGGRASPVEPPSVAHKIGASHLRRNHGGPGSASFGGIINDSSAPSLQNSEVQDLSRLATRSTPSILTDHGQWSIQGCFVDDPQHRIIAAEVQGNLPLTVERCMGRCWQFQYTVAGIENGRDCYCAESIDIYALKPAHLDECKSPCVGDESHACGGTARLLLYHHSSGTLYTPSRERIGDWESRGCYTDSPHARTLPYQFFTDGGMTIEKCTQICYEGGFEYAGTERASECYCGSSIENEGKQRPAQECDQACVGNGAQQCGGVHRLNIYHYEGQTLPTLKGLPSAADAFRPPTASWVYDGCHLDSALNRVLKHSVDVEGGMTIEKCAGACHVKGFIYAGIANGNECYCDNEHSAIPATIGCETPCSGNPEQNCGGIDRIIIYHLDGAKKEVSVPAPSSEDETEGWAFLTWLGHGCYVDSVTARIMSQIVTDEPMTVEHCLYLCQDVGFTVAGMEAGSECFCTTSLPPSKLQADPKECSTPCEGNPEQICGGPERLTVMYYSHAS